MTIHSFDAARISKQNAAIQKAAVEFLSVAETHNLSPWGAITAATHFIGGAYASLVHECPEEAYESRVAIEKGLRACLDHFEKKAAS